MTTPSTFRIPAATLDGPGGRLVAALARRTYGQVPDTVRVWWHHRPLVRALLRLERAVARFDELDAHLKAYAVMASAASIGCSWCLDFGYYLAHHDGLDEATVREVPRWRDSDAFTDLERDVMGYAEAMTATPPTVTDEMVAGLIEQLGVPAVVELTQMVALENMRSRVNATAGLTSQGFSDVCELPLAAARPPAPAAVPSAG
ncbi:carboxymuconolactone decarboxylase family protein [Nocardioides sp.]|uniref:carboxymuconolactone decarboxylase family protein n=1 Tax=Nocardioides sp. TaxID=35761 RepID=UPI003526C68E